MKPSRGISTTDQRGHTPHASAQGAASKPDPALSGSVDVAPSAASDGAARQTVDIPENFPGDLPAFIILFFAIITALALVEGLAR